MSIQIKTKETGFVYEVDYGEDIIDINSEVIKFGRYMIPFGNFPAYTPTTVPYYLPNASREANEFKIAKYDIEFGVMCQMVNGIPFYLMLGKSTTAAGIHTIEAQDIGTDKPSFTDRFKYESDQIDQIKHVRGCKVTSLTFEFDFVTNKIPQLILLIKGLQIVDPGFPEENAPVLPGTNQIYNKVPGLARWNSSDPTAGGEDIGPIMGNYSIQLIDSTSLEEPEINNKFVQKIIDGEFAYILKLAVYRGKTLTLTTYIQDFTNDTTPVNMALRMPRSSTEYFDHVLTGIYPKAPTKKENAVRDTEFDIYEFWVKSFSMPIKDGLDETIYYGE